MPRRSSPQATCAICMDSLFHSLDDLNEPIHVVSPECGHAFHKPCILDWFKMQGEQYLANAREHRLEREASPSLSEAPVCCPTCRVECYANPETGDPILLRLFLNFDDRHDDSGSSMIGSSPVQARTESRAENEELFAIARKAKALTADVKSLNARASVAEVETACTRGLALKEDATKTKAIQAVKTYVGGLTTSINALRFALNNDPMIAVLAAQLAETRQTANALRVQVKDFQDHVIPREIRKAEERCGKGEQKRRKLAEKEHDRLVRDLEAAKANRSAYEKEVNARMTENARTAQEQAKELARVREETRQLGQSLKERSAQLVLHKTKRERLQQQVKLLQAENAQLRSRQTESQTKQSAMPSRSNAIAGGSGTRAQTGSHAPATSPLGSPLFILDNLGVPDAGDDSLSVELPSFEDSYEYLPDPIPPAQYATASPARPRAHPTARTFQFDADRGISALDRKGKRKASKYFARDDSDDDINEVSDKRKGSSVLVDASSPIFRPADKRAKVNPFQTTREKSAARAKLPLPARRTTPIEIDSSSDVEDASPAPMSSTDLNIPAQSRAGGQGQKSMTEFFADKNGRPHKSLATGPKAKRRA